MIKRTNSKKQKAKKHQKTITKIRNKQDFGILEFKVFENWNLFVIWNLFFGIFLS
jgi:hypothetical protein